MTNKEPNLITIYTTPSLQEAHIVKSLLTSNDIEAFVLDENITSTIGTAFVEGYKLKISETYKEQAEKIIEEYNKE